MDYQHFYRLIDQPFSNVPDPKFYFESPQHSKAIVKLTYAAEMMKGLALVVGDIGTGKTTLSRRMLEILPDDSYETGLLVILHSEITPDWLLMKIALHLGVEHPASHKIDLITQVYEKLHEIREKEKKAIVIIDEANMLKSKEVMEEIRGLLNLEVGGQLLLTFLLFGLPELEECLSIDLPLRERIAIRHCLEPFNIESTRAYINYRLNVAGRSDSLFTDSALELIHFYSKGKPRLINIICDNALLEGSLMKKETIPQEIIETVVQDLALTV